MRDYWKEAEAVCIPSTLQPTIQCGQLLENARFPLELGCGIRPSSAELTIQKAVATDINLDALKTLRKRSSWMNLVCLDVLQLPFTSGSFDLIIAIALLTVIPEWKHYSSLFKEIHRVLEGGGYLYIMDFLYEPSHPIYSSRYRFSDAQTVEALGKDGGTLYLARHWRQREIEILCNPMKCEYFKVLNVLSRSGNPLHGFEAVYRKTSNS